MLEVQTAQNRNCGKIMITHVCTCTNCACNTMFYSWCLVQVANHAPRVLPSIVPQTQPSSHDRLPSDADRDACMKLYRKACKLRESGKTMSGTKKQYPCIGMEQICRQYEESNGLLKNSLIARTLRRCVIECGHNSKWDVSSVGCIERGHKSKWDVSSVG